MVTKLSSLIGAVVAVGLVVAGLWGWGSAPRLAHGADHADLILWAIRSAAVAALAAAQVLAISFLVDAFYFRDRGSEMVRLAASALCALALIGALTLAVLGR